MDTIKDTIINNDIDHKSISELEQVEAYLHEQGLHAQAVDVRVLIAEKIMDKVHKGEINTSPRTDKKELFQSVKNLAASTNGNN